MDVLSPRTYDLIEHSNADHARTVLVDWMLGNSCSYACSYCPKSLHDGSVRWQTAEAVLGFYETLHTHYVLHRGKRVWIQFTGGEPTMHPQIIRFLDEASARGFSVSLISNASRSLRFWRKIARYLDSAILTYHDEFADHDAFIGVGRILSERMPVHINVTMHPDRFDRALGEAKALRAAMASPSITLKPLRIGFDTDLFDYTNEQLQRMSDGLPSASPSGGATPRGTMTVSAPDIGRQVRRANEFMIRGENRWKGYRCNAGLESLRINGDGRVSRAVCSVGGEIGVLGGTIEMLTAPILCTAGVCGCVADILITKARLPSHRQPAPL